MRKATRKWAKRAAVYRDLAPQKREEYLARFRRRQTLMIAIEALR